MIEMTGFPLLSALNHLVTSEKNPEYNCIAWAAGEQTRYRWPDADGDGYWPTTAAREETIQAFVQAYQAIGYLLDVTNNSTLEHGIEKIAIFALGAEPKHAARQLPDGQWTSKMGSEEDIWHELAVLEGPCYGSVVRILRRPIKATL